MKKSPKFRRDGKSVLKGNAEYAIASNEVAAATIVYALNFAEGRETKDEAK